MLNLVADGLAAPPLSSPAAGWTGLEALDIIDNTAKAFNVSATSPTGYGDLGPPTGRYLAPANGPDCMEVAQSDNATATTGYGDCGTRELVATGPPQVRFDLSVVKRVPVEARIRAEFPAAGLPAAVRRAGGGSRLRRY